MPGDDAPRLILLNGPPGIGKSTLAGRWVAGQPLALNLDLDLVRSLLGGGSEHLTDRWLRTRELALAMARVQLEHGADVIVPQFLGRPTFIEQLAGLASEIGARFVELALLTDRADAVRRFHARPSGPVETTARLHAMYDDLLAILAARPHTSVLTSRAGAIDETYAQLVTLLNEVSDTSPSVK